MAPRRRTTKKDTRMHAALDAMTPYGFPHNLVRRTVHELLKVYGGDDGWVFIEESAYTLLIETLLEKQATASASPQDGDNPGVGHNEASPAGCSNRPLLPCSNTETYDDASLTNQAVVTVSAASETGNHLPIKAVDTVSATSGSGILLPIMAVNTVSATSETGHQVPIKAVAAVSADNGSDCHGTPLACSPSPQTKSPQPVKMLCHKRHRPCHGWISDDDEEEELKQVELPPPPFCLN